MILNLSDSGIARYMDKLSKEEQFIKHKLGVDILANLSELTPVRTGKLRSSYSIDEQGDDLIITNDAGYCHYVNDGTSKQRGQHFIEQSVSKSIRDFNKYYKK